MKPNPFLIKIIRLLSLLFLIGIFFSNALMQIATTIFFPIVIYLIIRHIKERKLTPLELLIILLFFSSILSIYLSPNPSIAVKNIIYHSILLIIIPLSYLTEYDKKTSIYSVGKMISVFALLTACLGIVRFSSGAERAFGFFGGYYTLACILAFSIPITVAMIFYSKNLWKYITIISCPGSGSRSVVYLYEKCSFRVISGMRNFNCHIIFSIRH